MRKALDGVYAACAVAAGIFLVLIGFAIVLQIVGRHLGFQVPSADDIAGLSMAASLFLGLAPTLRAGRHIRVALVLSRLPLPLRRGEEGVLCLLGTLFFGYFGFHAAQMTVDSFTIGERTGGLLPIPLWIPQTAMSLGLIVMTIALAEDLVRVLRGGLPVYGVAEAAHLRAEGLGKMAGTSFVE
jgi:TRAP-type C4-dicarboxylate transport system permease small subunit